MHPKTHHSLRNIPEIRSKLLEFYDSQKRDLEWRIPIQDLQLRAYRVWVSEIMLQQTRVETVKEYYKKWMQKWPTLSDFVKAKEGEVHALWSGLGYYSRATRLLQGAQQVMNDWNGMIPSTPEELSQIAGIGPYTAGAISSIAFEQPVPLVDGNVIRVLTRMTALSGDTKSKPILDKIWKLAGHVVDPARPGCFNQSLMELGATVCTPTNPSCATCPVRGNCTAFIEQQSKRKRTDDIEDVCTDCPKGSFSVTDYPTKIAKKEARKETVVVCIIQVGNEYLLVQNPAKGLLANLWDFPNVLLDDREPGEVIKDVFQVTSKSIGSVVHKFSHIHRTMMVELVTLSDKKIDLKSLGDRKTQWVTASQFSDGLLGIPITHTKAWQLYEKQTILKSKKSNFFTPKKK